MGINADVAEEAVRLTIEDDILDLAGDLPEWQQRVFLELATGTPPDKIRANYEQDEADQRTIPSPPSSARHPHADAPSEGHRVPATTRSRIELRQEYPAGEVLGPGGVLCWSRDGGKRSALSTGLGLPVVMSSSRADTTATSPRMGGLCIVQGVDVAADHQPIIGRRSELGPNRAQVTLGGIDAARGVRSSVGPATAAVGWSDRPTCSTPSGRRSECRGRR